MSRADIEQLMSVKQAQQRPGEVTMNRRDLIASISFVALASTLSLSAAPLAQEYPFGPPPWKIGFSQDTMDHPWRAFMVTSAEEQAKQYPDLVESFVYTDG